MLRVSRLSVLRHVFNSESDLSGWQSATTTQGRLFSKLFFVVGLFFFFNTHTSQRTFIKSRACQLKRYFSFMSTCALEIMPNVSEKRKVKSKIKNWHWMRKAVFFPLSFFHFLIGFCRKMLATKPKFSKQPSMNFKGFTSEIKLKHDFPKKEKWSKIWVYDLA